MKQITFNEKQYNIPENWNEVTLGMVIKVSELDELIGDAPIISIICGYTGIPDNELKISKMPDIKPILDIMDFIYTPYVPTPVTRFKFGDVEYHTKESIEETEFQEWVSTQTILYKFKDNPIQSLPRLIAVICKRENETLDDIDIDERAKMFLDLPLPIARDIECFFLHSQRALNAVSLLYSTASVREQLVLLKFNELNDLMIKRSKELGWYSPTRFVIGIYRLYLKSLKHELEKSFNSKRTDLSKKNWIATYKNSLTKKFAKSKPVSF